MKKLFRAIVLGIVLIEFFTACATTAEPSEAYKNETPRQIFLTGKKALQDKDYVESTKRFEALDIQYPFGRDTESAQLYLIYTYYMKEDYALSVAAADHFIRLHPASPNVAYAYYMRGIAEYYQNLGLLERIFAIDLAKRDLTQIQKSYSDFNEVYTRFPNSYYAPAAHQYMVYLRNVMADHELHVAEYYYDRQAYIAASNRASGIVAHYQGAPMVTEALVIMAKSYRKLGLVKKEQDTLAVINYNYPGLVINYDSDYGS